MGQTVCGAVERAGDMELVARADPALGAPLPDALAERPDVLVDFTVPETAVVNARQAVAAGVHVVIGTTGFDPAELNGLSGANVFVAVAGPGASSSRRACARPTSSPTFQRIRATSSCHTALKCSASRLRITSL